MRKGRIEVRTRRSRAFLRHSGDSKPSYTTQAIMSLPTPFGDPEPSYTTQAILSLPTPLNLEPSYITQAILSLPTPLNPEPSYTTQVIPSLLHHSGNPEPYYTTQVIPSLLHHSGNPEPSYTTGHSVTSARERCRWLWLYIHVSLTFCAHLELFCNYRICSFGMEFSIWGLVRVVFRG